MAEKLTYDVLANDDLSSKFAKMASACDKLTAQMRKLNTDGRSAGEGLTAAERAAQRAAAGMERAAAGARQAGEGMARSGSQAASASSGFSAAAASVASFFGNIGANIVSGLVSKIAQLGQSIITLGISTAASNQTAAISFEVLLGSADKAQKFLAELQAFAAATPFELPDLKTAASRLLAVGVRAKDIIPLMTRLGDATAGMGTGAEGIQRAVYALQQMKLAGKVSLEDINQLQDAGIPALDALASYTHKTVAQIRDMISKGTLKSDTLFGAIQAGAGPAFARLKGMMERQSATLQGVWSTLKDNVSQTLAKAFEPAIPSLTKLTLWAGTALPQVIANVQAVGAKLRPYIMEIGTLLSGVMSKFNFGSSLGAIANDAKKFADAIKTNWPEIKQIIGWVGGAIGVIVKVILTLVDWVIKLDTFMVGVWSGIMDLVNKVATVFLNGLGLIVRGAANAFGWIPGLGPKLREAADRFDEFRNRVNNALNGIPRTIDITIREHVYSMESPSNFFHGFASGGLAKGWAVVGEKGPELAYFGGSGAYIVPNNQIQPVMASPMATGGTWRVELVASKTQPGASDLERFMGSYLMRAVATGAVQLRVLPNGAVGTR